MPMLELRRRFRLAAVCVTTAIAVGCSMATTTGPAHDSVVGQRAGPSLSESFASTDALKGPLLIAVNDNDQALEAYPMRPGGGNHARLLTKPGQFGDSALVANGRVIAGISQSSDTVVIYDLATQTAKTLADPNGTPVDIAIGKDSSLYVIDFTKGPTNVTMYPGGSPNPKKLACAVQDTSENIAVDDEGDIFLNGYDKNAIGVVEIPNGKNGPEPGKCHALQLQPENGYEAGIAIDPKSDALITLEDPDLCAGGEEGRMTIYPKPYKPNDYQWHDIGQNCTGGLRLNRDSTIIFAGDEDVSGSYSYVIQSSYPDGRYMGSYHSGQPGGFTTIPNTLPN
jgi:hypothetical protein